MKAAALRRNGPLQPHQARVVRRVNDDDPNLLIYHGLGSGKTRLAIEAAEASGEPYTAIVPASLRPNFQGELGRWTDGASPAEVMSYTQAARGLRPSATPGTLILDEASRIRNPDTAMSRAVADIASHAKRTLLLSGTPIVNDPTDLAGPLSILTGRTITPKDFASRFVGKKDVYPGLVSRLMGVPSGVEPTLKNEGRLERLLRGHVDYHPPRLPEGVDTHEERIPVELSDEQQQFHKLLWGKLPWWTRWKLRNDFPLAPSELRNLQAFMTGPRQAGLSLLPFSADKDPRRAFEHSPKLRAAAARLEAALADPRAKALVFSNFIGAGLEPYDAELTRAGIPHALFHGGLSDAARRSAIADYNRGKVRALLLGPSGSEGLSTRGTQLIQLLDPHFNAARGEQSAGRGLRYDSHVGLPDDLKDVKIQRFVSTTPRPGFFGRLFGAKRDPSADEVLEAMAARKERLNEQFRDVLRRVGSEET